MIVKSRWWKKKPLLRPLLLFGAGILAARFFGEIGFLPAVLLFGVGSAYELGLFIYGRFKTKNYRWQNLYHLGFVIILFSFGFLYARLRNVKSQANYIEQFSIRGNVNIFGKITSIKPRPGKSTRYCLELLKIDSQAVCGQVWLYDSSHVLQEGMTICVWGRLALFKDKQRKEWEENAYARGIDGILLARRPYKMEIKQLPSTTQQSFFFCQKYIKKAFARNLPDTLAAYASALCIGDKEGLSRSMQNDYTACGLSHILAVSGMHLGLVVLALQKILFFIRKRIRLQTVLLIVFIWGFALLSGASAAVLRAAMMYSVSLAAPLFYRKAKAENGIVASLFILLLIEPAYLFDVGFELSYAAIISILWIYPKLRQLMYVRNKILLALWDLVCISIAAQMLTAPFCLFYFKQFPNYFLLSNLWAIPVSTIVLYALLALLCISPAIQLSALIGKICVWLMLCLNGVIHWIAHLDGAVSRLDHFNTLNAIGLLLVVFWALRLLEKTNAARIIQAACIIPILFF